MSPRCIKAKIFHHVNPPPRLRYESFVEHTAPWEPQLHFTFESSILVQKTDISKTAWINPRVHKMIFNKKKDNCENKLDECIGKQKELWKALKSLGLPKKSFHVKWAHWKSIKQSNMRLNSFKWIQRLLF